jgi:hypothetical protein
MDSFTAMWDTLVSAAWDEQDAYYEQSGLIPAKVSTYYWEADFGEVVVW